MSETKACNLTKAEIEKLINWHGYTLEHGLYNRLERMNYLHKRLKSFDEDKPKASMTDAKSDGISAATASNPATGWPTNG